MTCNFQTKIETPKRRTTPCKEEEEKEGERWERKNWQVEGSWESVTEALIQTAR
jgi:hypothetical protein